MTGKIVFFFLYCYLRSIMHLFIRSDNCGSAYYASKKKNAKKNEEKKRKRKNEGGNS